MTPPHPDVSAQGEPGRPTGKMAEEEVKGRKKRLLQTVGEPHTQLLVSVREGGVPAPRGRNRCLTLYHKKPLEQGSYRIMFASQPHTLTHPLVW